MPSMKALAIDAYGPLDSLRVVELPIPEPRPGQVRVRVDSSAANPADWKTVTGTVKILHGRQFPLVPGYDFSGVVDALGEGVSGYAVGDDVFGFLHYGSKTKQGAFAEHLVCGADTIAKKPSAVSHAVAAAAATPGLTALQAIRDQGRLSKGGRVLVIGAAGGVGSLAVGIAKRLGAHVTGVCSSYAVDLVKELGADEVIDRSKTDPLAGGGPYDVVLDAASVHSYAACGKVLAPGGTYVTLLPSLSWLTGKIASLFSSRRCTFLIVEPRTKDLEQIGAWLVDGLRVPIDDTIPVREAARAIARVQKGGLRGRIAVDVAGGF